VRLLTAGEVAALPTETVYGLAAAALRPEAVVKIFEAKERPKFDPLIVHLPDQSWLERVANVDTLNKEIVSRLIEAFWPGPFTIILPKTDLVPDIVTAGLDTVAVRISAHPIFQDIIRAFGEPLAAPSANRFGRISPTTAQHVLGELGGRIPLIVDGGPTTHGVESTIVSVCEGQIEILRPGPITAEDLRGIGGSPMGHRPAADATKGAFVPFAPREEVVVRQGANLPHWSQTGATYAVTFRLADALPAEIVAEWERERHDITTNAKQQDRELSDSERQRLAKLFSDKVERFLDAGAGECWFRDGRIAGIMVEALKHFDGKRYELLAWCIMPNHVHVVVQPKAPFSLSQILQTWKSVSAHRANQLLHRTGEIWQPESYDHLVRDEADLENQIRYAEENPSKAGLRHWRWVSSGIGGPPMSHRPAADATVPIRAPGQLPSHYAPDTPLRLIENVRFFSAELQNQRVGLLAWNAVESDEGFSAIRRLSETQDLREGAANLFKYLRELDDAGLDLIVAERVPEKGLGVAINDRLRRAASAAIR
jgi:tRNA threonylcarbamoyl adenosine modification protein (Sua5/YciO/YrdC/YwlC family)